MTFLALQPLSAALLPAALVLDQRCFGGLWTLDGYRRELESPNSELLVLIRETEGRRQEAGEAEAVGEDEETEVRPELKTQNLKNPTPHASPLLGLGCYWAVLEEAHITMLAIDPTHQRQGLGQALLYALMASAHARGLERATLEVRISNQSALSLYQKFDFCEAGRRRRYYPDNGEDALVLWRGGLQRPEFAERLKVWQQQVCDRLCTPGWQLAVSGDRFKLNSQCLRD
ncbi:ribosomal protein S18-alanine N-acetyltransferase [Stenomitos frigidus]|uniref:Ribosomal-protein-alanine N-acetyltransferase n=1 Tax=Stenomitos frigidus ULC18 TaxID=2107698 RepID=A0A2T1EIX2_9CYAN|nr:ribosomal protein S18-alanine N-acetyltransferase [Stenomitos frigidus]PSB32628.1 ribosomal-protein-alanine N-acetyltransferase [Stenomitos frigidus ULC18]